MRESAPPARGGPARRGDRSEPWRHRRGEGPEYHGPTKRDKSIPTVHRIRPTGESDLEFRGLWTHARMQIPSRYDARADGPADQRPFGYSIQPKESGSTALSGAAMNDEHGCAVLTFILVLSSVPATLGRADRPSETKALSLCELVANWKEYNRQTVQVRALFRTGPEEDW